MSFTNPHDGWSEVSFSSNVFKLIGPLFQKNDEQSVRYGMRVDHKHLNVGNTRHGGFIVSLLDGCVGAIVSHKNAGFQPVTGKMTISFHSPLTV